jgi:hypothetical protein
VTTLAAESDVDTLRLHAEALVMDGASFFRKGYDAEIAESGVDSFNIMAPWPGDDFVRAVERIESYHDLVSGEPRAKQLSTREMTEVVMVAPRPDTRLGSS